MTGVGVDAVTVVSDTISACGDLAVTADVTCPSWCIPCMTK